MKKEAKGKAGSLKGGDKDERTKTSLHISVAKYLDQNGFSKTLKKFLKEAHIQKDNLDDVSVSLEQIFTKYLEASNCALEYLGNQKPQVVEGDCKKNKKSSGENEDHVVVKQSEVSSELAGSKKSKEVTNDTVPSSDVKSKEKKKHKKNLESAENVVDSVKAKVDDIMSEDNLDGAAKKSAQKRENKSGSESVEGATNKENKKSKKRKGSALEENDSKSRKTVESKHKETEEVEITEGCDDHSGKQLNGVGVKAGLDASIQTPSKDLTFQENGNTGKEEQKTTSQKSSKKQLGNSSEPKTVNAFCRVKIDEVTFADERLQDNSYWAKDGADSGYGAKAQEVLGQVRGRDFRHEKTKKKRGSYRGGLIDLQSHSVKFNYSDEDE